MSSKYHPRCPPLRFGKPDLGETRTLSNGDFEYKDRFTGAWTPAVRLNDVRPQLIANAALSGSYSETFPFSFATDNLMQTAYDRGIGKEIDNVTAYLHEDKGFGGDRDHRPDVLFLIERDAKMHKKKPDGVKKHGTKVLLDPFDHPIRNFPELPATLSTEMKGWEVQYYLLKNLEIKTYDLMALCMSGYRDGKGKHHEGPPRVASLTEKATKFRQKAGLPHIRNKLGSENIKSYIKSPLPTGAKTTKDLDRDPTSAEVNAARVKNKGQHANRRRKSTREKEEHETIGKRPVHPGSEGPVQSAQLHCAPVDAPITDPPQSIPNVSLSSVDQEYKGSRGVKRILDEASLEAESADIPKPKRRMKKVAAKNSEVHERRIQRKRKDRNIVSQQPQILRMDSTAFAIESSTPEPIPLEGGATVARQLTSSASPHGTLKASGYPETFAVQSHPPFTTYNDASSISFPSHYNALESFDLPQQASSTYEKAWLANPSQTLSSSMANPNWENHVLGYKQQLSDYAQTPYGGMYPDMEDGRISCPWTQEDIPLDSSPYTYNSVYRPSGSAAQYKPGTDGFLDTTRYEPGHFNSAYNNGQHTQGVFWHSPQSTSPPLALECTLHSVPSNQLRTGLLKESMQNSEGEYCPNDPLANQGLFDENALHLFGNVVQASDQLTTGTFTAGDFSNPSSSPVVHDYESFSGHQAFGSQGHHSRQMFST